MGKSPSSHATHPRTFRRDLRARIFSRLAMRAHLYSQHTALHHSCSWWVAGATGGAIARKSPSSHATHPRTFRRDLHARIFSRLAMHAHLYSQHTALHHSCSWWVAGATGGAI